tara:strand:- start:15 stop:200 length:186 start_codon:yes stop_codon:yes gene_type:complete
MNWKIINGSIDGIIYLNMENVRLIRSGEEDGFYCIYLDTDTLLFRSEDLRNECIRELTGFN